MLPESQAADTINSLIDVFKDFQGKRANLSLIHEQRIQGLVDKVPADSRIIAECMRDCFLRRFDQADQKLDQASSYSWSEGSYELNIATGLLESFRYDDCLGYLKNVLNHHRDDPEFLYDACNLLVARGMYITAKEICDRLEKLNSEPSEVYEVADFFSKKYSEFGISDEAVADFATKAAAQLKEHIRNDPKSTYEIKWDFQQDSSPQTIAVIFSLDADIEEIVDLSESIADYMAEFEFEEPVDLHVAYSVWAYSEEKLKHAS